MILVEDEVEMYEWDAVMITFFFFLKKKKGKNDFCV